MRTVCFIDKEGGVGTCLMEAKGLEPDCENCEFKKKFEGKERMYFVYTAWTGELKETKGDKVMRVVRRIIRKYDELLKRLTYK